MRPMTVYVITREPGCIFYAVCASRPAAEALLAEWVEKRVLVGADGADFDISAEIVYD